jgi:hypothetical protein
MKYKISIFINSIIFNFSSAQCPVITIRGKSRFEFIEYDN